MWVLLGKNDKPEPFVYFIGVFNSVLVVKEKLQYLMATRHTTRSDYIIKYVTVNELHDYSWSNNGVDEITSF
jgi:hypothetical protein